MLHSAAVFDCKCRHKHVHFSALLDTLYILLIIYFEVCNLDGDIVNSVIYKFDPSMTMVRIACHSASRTFQSPVFLELERCAHIYHSLEYSSCRSFHFGSLCVSRNARSFLHYTLPLTASGQLATGFIHDIVLGTGFGPTVLNVCCPYVLISLL